MTEYDIQCNFVKFLEKLKEEQIEIYYTAIPNSTYTISWASKAKNKKLGLRAGLCDMFLIVNNVPFFLELKSLSGKLSKEQKNWIEKINKTNIIKAYVCYTYEQAVDLVLRILKNNV